MTNEPKDPKPQGYHPDVPDEEITNEQETTVDETAEREKRIQERIAELRKRDPFIYR